jgi:hypothetical protein
MLFIAHWSCACAHVFVYRFEVVTEPVDAPEVTDMVDVVLCVACSWPGELISTRAEHYRRHIGALLLHIVGCSRSDAFMNTSLKTRTISRALDVHSDGE